jgi:Dolichyl-phosphate-mannose-protein mannosyltransferase
LIASILTARAKERRRKIYVYWQKMTINKQRYFEPPLLILLAAVFLVVGGTAIRLYGTMWDGMASLHPDERHLIFVVLDRLRALADTGEITAGISDIWFNAAQSPLNPRAGGRSFVYGEFPILCITILAHLKNMTGWDEVLTLGRTVSAYLDGATILAVFLLGQPVFGHRVGLFSAFLYAVAPTALQLANFYTVDIWLVSMTAWFFVFLSAMVRVAWQREVRSARLLVVMAGACLGLAMACKANAIILFFPACLAVGIILLKNRKPSDIFLLLLGAVVTGLTFRLANPFAFSGPGFFGLTLEARFVADMQSVLSISARQDFPPNWQWQIGYSAFSFFRDFALFGIGPVCTVFCILAAVYAAKNFKLTGVSSNGAICIVGISYAVISLAIVGNGAVPVLRYAAPILPWMAVFAATGLIIRKSRFIEVFAIFFAAWWASGIVLLHAGNHPRLLASYALWNLPSGTVLLNETGWDEGLPVILQWPDSQHKRWPDYDDHFTLLQLDITDPDTPEKVGHMVTQLNKADYLILSSGRQSEVIPALPNKFPMTSTWYKMLFSGEACWDEAWQYDRGYPLPGWRFYDTWAQEPWRVYDHPIVRIYRKMPCFNGEAIRQKLIEAL